MALLPDTLHEYEDFAMLDLVLTKPWKRTSSSPWAQPFISIQLINL